jgi:signal transduction histidine kinase
VVVTGNEGLLKEATMELLENACRHGSPACPIGIATFAEGSSALLTVTSQAQRVEEEPVTSPDGPTENHGIGLTVVRWIASEHGGKLAHAQVGDVSVYKLYLPLVHQEETLPEASQSSTVPA